MDENIKQQIEKDVKNNKVFLYMKGTPEFPMCGFSARAVEILRAEGADFASTNVLESDLIREGIKEYSEWPTIPQLYINGEFIGGCDIMTEMHASGDLSKALSS